MSKPHRGKSLWKLEGRGRGICPLCGTKRIKLLYPLTINGKHVDVCKRCRKKSPQRADNSR